MRTMRIRIPERLYVASSGRRPQEPKPARRATTEAVPRCRGSQAEGCRAGCRKPTRLRAPAAVRSSARPAPDREQPDPDPTAASARFAPLAESATAGGVFLGSAAHGADASEAVRATGPCRASGPAPGARCTAKTRTAHSDRCHAAAGGAHDALAAGRASRFPADSHRLPGPTERAYGSLGGPASGRSHQSALDLVRSAASEGIHGRSPGEPDRQGTGLRGAVRQLERNGLRRPGQRFGHIVGLRGRWSPAAVVPGRGAGQAGQAGWVRARARQTRSRGRGP